MFFQVFETVDDLTFHLPWGLEIFTESVFMYDICCLEIIERDSKICVLGTWLSAFHYIKETKVMECSLRSLSISLTVYSKNFQVHLYDMLRFEYKFIDSQMKRCFQEGQKTKFRFQTTWKMWHLRDIRLSLACSFQWTFFCSSCSSSISLLNALRTRPNQASPTTQDGQLQAGRRAFDILPRRSASPTTHPNARKMDVKLTTWLQLLIIWIINWGSPTKTKPAHLMVDIMMIRIVPPKHL